MSAGAGIRFAPDPPGLLDRVVEWAQTDSGVRALLLLGSRARSEQPPDEWSDTDLLIVVPVAIDEARTGLREPGPLGMLARGHRLLADKDGLLADLTALVARSAGEE